MLRDKRKQQKDNKQDDSHRNINDSDESDFSDDNGNEDDASKSSDPDEVKVNAQDN